MPPSGLPLDGLPGLSEGADHCVERPGGARLVGEVIALGRDILWLAEKLVRLVGVPLPRPWHVDNGVDRHVAAVYPLWPE